jgi:ABC-type polysaccharide/polyol phosphate export permease
MKTSETVIYDSADRGPKALEELRAVFEYRDLIYQLVRRDIVSRYKRSVLGVAWTMLQPLGMMIIISIVFSQLFNRVGGYPVYLLSGLIVWNFFSQTTNAIIHQMVWGGPLLRKIYMPQTSFALSAIGTGLVNISLSLVPLILIMLIVGIPMQWSLFFLPVAMILLAAFALGIGLLVSTIAVFFPDVSEMFQIILLGWMYLTPIIYPIDIIPERFQMWFKLNPMYYFVQLFRLPVYEGLFPPLQTIVIGLSLALTVLVFGWLIFSLKSDEFSYRA